MSELNYVALLAAAVAAFVVSSVWYTVVGTQSSGAGAAAAATRPPAWKMLIELGRSLIVAGVLAGLVVQAGITGAAGAALLGLVVWLGFPVVLLVGSVIWENVPWRTAAVHGGDWLVKLTVVALIVGAWR